MIAAISGRAELAILREGDQWFSLHLGESEPIPRRWAEVTRLVDGFRDFRWLAQADAQQVAEELDLEIRSAEALQLTLIALDSTLPMEGRLLAIEELEEDLVDPAVRESVESVMFSHPLPSGGDLNQARDMARGEQVDRLFFNLVIGQDLITQVEGAWTAIPDHLFAPGWREAALAIAVRNGVFRDLVFTIDETSLEHLWSIGEKLHEVPNHRRIWLRWLQEILPVFSEMFLEFDSKVEWASEVAEPTTQYQVFRASEKS